MIYIECVILWMSSFLYEEIIVGVTCLVIWFGAVFSIPALVAMLVDSKEEADRQNS